MTVLTLSTETAEGPEKFAQRLPRGGKKQPESSPGQKPMFEDVSTDHIGLWREELHPREPGGQFTFKGTGHIKSSPGQKRMSFSDLASRIHATEEHADMIGPKRAQQIQQGLFRTLAESNATPEQIKALLSGDPHELATLKQIAEHTGQTDQPAQKSGAEFMQETERLRQHRESMSAALDVPRDARIAMRDKRNADRQANQGMLPSPEQVQAELAKRQPAPDHSARAAEILKRIPAVSAAGMAKQLGVSEEEGARLLAAAKGQPPEHPNVRQVAKGDTATTSGDRSVDLPNEQQDKPPAASFDQPFGLERGKVTEGRPDPKPPAEPEKQGLLLDEMHDLPGQKRFFGGEEERAKEKAEARKFMTAGEAAKAGKSHADWTGEAHQAYVNEEIDDDHPAWKAIEPGTAPTPAEFNRARDIHGQHVRFYNYGNNRHEYGKVTDVGDDAKTITVTKADGKTYKTSPDAVDHLDSFIKHHEKKGRDTTAAREYLAQAEKPKAADFDKPPEPAKPAEKFRPDVHKDSIWAQGKKRTMFGPQSVAAASFEGANAVWWHQGDPDQTRFNAAQSGASEWQKQTAAEIEAAHKAGYRRVNHRAGKKGTVWLFEKDGRILTKRGIKSLMEGGGSIDLPEGTQRESAGDHIKATASFIRSLPESTQNNLGALAAAINRSPLGQHVTLDRSPTSGELRLAPKKGSWFIHEPSNGHDADGKWHQSIESSLPRFLAKLDHMAANDLSEAEHWTDHDRAAEAHALEQHPIGGKKAAAEAPAAAAVEEKPKAADLDAPAAPAGPMTLEHAAEHSRKIRSGETTAAEIKQWFEHWHGSQAALKEELANKSVAELKKMGAGGWHAAGMKKAELIADMTRRIGDQYHVGESMSYMPTQEKHADALRRHVEKQTDDDVKKYAEKVKKYREERQQQVAGTIKAIENPETLEEFQTFAKAKGTAAMTDEQLATYDNLRAADRRKKDVAKKATVTGFRPGTEATGAVSIVEGHHKKRNQPTYTVTVEQHLGDNWDEALSRAKRLGGSYVNARIAKAYGATPGFQFFDKKSAEQFSEVLGGKTADRTEQVAQQKAESIENASERLAALAANTHAEADEQLGKDRLTNTSRRAEHAASAEATARSRKALAETMERLSGAMKEGKASHLEGIRHRAHVEELNWQLRRARYARMKTEKANDLPHDKYQEFSDRPAEHEDIRHAEYPYPQIWSDQLQKHAEALKEEPGLMRIAQRLKKAATAEVKFKGQGGGVKFSGGQVLQQSHLPNVHGLPEGKGIRVHQSHDYRITKDRKGPVYTADGGKSFGTTPEIAVSAAASRGNQLDLVDLPQAELLTFTDPGDIEDLTTAAKRLRRRAHPELRRIGEDLSSRLDSYKRMQAMDIKTPAEMRAALRDYLPLRTKPKGEDKIKKLERDLIGKKIEGFFPTPRPVIERMIDAADIQPGHDVLEPSAGKGDILDAIRERHPDTNTHAIEPVSSLREIIEAKGHNLVDRDFTSHEGTSYDRIVMNPPFERGQDAEHVQHAYKRLKAGGRIVAVMSAGPFQRSDKKAEAFREWLESVGGSAEDLPEGSFAGKDAFRQTGVNTKLVVIDKSESE